MKENPNHERFHADPPTHPFNSAIYHYQKIAGMSFRLINTKKLSKPIRWFGYFVIACILAGVSMLLAKLVLQFFK
ncbi:hypothetical protein [Brevibacillus choshinensis]|uniref:hypothetical protein n=1 Tax=Brevibacillus choshinensis TaxID=54911 RepID=UPI002E1E5B45|nr:hypothetical protein [Brevibacillus choshinensis]MED4755414.1 hypothetical protein [Brevibacillus choshinensis]MED4785285.1 hypothetical protein [Brevibacillus choshinensis]